MPVVYSGSELQLHSCVMEEDSSLDPWLTTTSAHYVGISTCLRAFLGVEAGPLSRLWSALGDEFKN